MAIKPGKPTGDPPSMGRDINKYNSYKLNRNIPASTKHVLFDYYHCLVCQKEKECKRDYPERPDCPYLDLSYRRCKR